jgi:hypothetical protein
LFKRNIQFSRLIKAGGSMKEFNFRNPYGTKGQLYHVDVSDERGNRISFSMRHEDALWKLQETLLPSWITKAEDQLQEAIFEQEKVI